LDSVRRSPSSDLDQRAPAPDRAARLSRLGATLPGAARLLLLLGGLIAAGVALRALRPGWVSLAPAGTGASTFLATAALALAVGVPRQVAAFAGGYAFGAGAGTLLAWLATLLACAADFYWARLVAGGWARRRFSGRLARLEQVVADRPFAATLAVRLFPLGNNLAVNLAAGVTAVAPVPFLTASALGYLPQTIVFALLGDGVHVAQGVQIALGTVLFGISAALGVALFRQFRFGAGRPAG
jgi:uncharacterized membrane protein YdjX (TVP38/TMEM64 family)